MHVRRPSFTCHEFHPRLRHIQVPKYRSRQIRLRQVVSAMGKTSIQNEKQPRLEP